MKSRCVHYYCNVCHNSEKCTWQSDHRSCLLGGQLAETDARDPNKELHELGIIKSRKGWVIGDSVKGDDQ